MKTKISQILKLGAILLALALASFSIAYAAVETRIEQVGDLIIRRTTPESTFVGQKIWIAVEIQNDGVQEKTITFIEKLGNADFDQSQAKFIEIFDPGYYELPTSEPGERPKHWYYEWKIQLPPNQSATLAYWLIPNAIGTYVISPARITIDGEEFYTASRDIYIKCIPDEQCDVGSGENYLTCPEDCTTGIADGSCDGASDGRMDPDCEEGYDPDPAAIPTSEILAPTLPSPSPTPAPALEKTSESLVLYLVIVVGILAVAVVALVILLIRRTGKRE